MPTYDYHCARCGDFDALRRIADRNAPAPCPHCGTTAQRVYTQAPQLACTSAELRRAHDTNERAQHAPRSSRDGPQGSYSRMKHPAACGCCNSSQRRNSVTAASGLKTLLGQRPWMISH
jgi:putative FmdB family regulatory protein